VFVKWLSVRQALRLDPDLRAGPPEVVKAVALALELGGDLSRSAVPPPPTDAEVGPSTSKKISWGAGVALEDGDSAQRLHERSMAKRKAAVAAAHAAAAAQHAEMQERHAVQQQQQHMQQQHMQQQQQQQHMQQRAPQHPAQQQAQHPPPHAQRPQQNVLPSIQGAASTSASSAPAPAPKPAMEQRAAPGALGEPGASGPVTPRGEPGAPPRPPPQQQLHHAHSAKQQQQHMQQQLHTVHSAQGTPRGFTAPAPQARGFAGASLPPGARLHAVPGVPPGRGHAGQTHSGQAHTGQTGQAGPPGQGPAGAPLPPAHAATAAGARLPAPGGGAQGRGARPPLVLAAPKAGPAAQLAPAAPTAPAVGMPAGFKLPAGFQPATPKGANGSNGKENGKS